MRSRFFNRLGGLMLVWAMGMWTERTAWAKEEYVLGGEDHPWTSSGELKSMDTTMEPGWIMPIQLSSTYNLSLGLRARGGDVITFFGSVGGWWGLPPEITDQMIDGDPSTAFVHEPQRSIYGGGLQRGGISYVWGPVALDLGAPFPVNRIRFYPRKGYEHHLVTEYKFSLCDGSPENLKKDKTPIYTLVRHELENLKPVVDLGIPLQLVRYVQVFPLNADQTWEIAEFEVYGEGYTPFASYTSEVIDFGGIANVGKIRWEGARDPAARILIYTRSGKDEDRNVYWRKTGIGDEEVRKTESGKPLTKADYDALPFTQRGRITYDTENWSFWSAPYDFEEGQKGMLVVSPSPRRYFQMKVGFFPTLTDGGKLDFIAVEFSRSLPASEITAEIFPVEVRLAERTTFTYALRPRMESGNTGFDRLQITTEVAPDTVRWLRIDAVDVDFSVVPVADPVGFVLGFPRVERDQTLVELAFDCSVLRYGTTFAGKVSDSASDELPQWVTEGNVTDKLPGNTLSVKTTLGERLIASVDVSPNPFTPNADGINDNLRISYSILQLTGTAPVSLYIYDLSGALVRWLYTGENTYGQYIQIWDGTTEDGEVVQPGMYLYQIRVQTDEGNEETSGVVGVVY